MRKIKNGLTIAMAAVVAMGLLAPIHATVVDDQTITKDESAECVVTYTQESSFTVTIPKTVDLGEDKTTDYEVNVVGDIASNEKITVKPDATFKMVDQSNATVKKADVTATVTQATQEFVYSDINVDGGKTVPGNIDAQDLTAGSWKGTFNFAIALETE
jgi:hypothetical protein